MLLKIVGYKSSPPRPQSHFVRPHPQINKAESPIARAARDSQTSVIGHSPRRSEALYRYLIADL